MTAPPGPTGPTAPPDQTGPGVPPGWYRDPYAPAPYAHAGLRWWDGHHWTPHVMLPAPPRPPLPPYAGRNGPIGRLGMLLWAPVQVGYLALFGLALGPLLRDLARFVEEASTAPPGEPPPLPTGGFTATMLLSLAGMLAWIPLVLIVVWAYRCATTAAALGIPAAREPYWAVLGWIVPVVSFWFPYQSLRDCLPPDHPARADVLRWWLGYLAVGIGGAAALVPLVLAGVTAFLVGLAVLAAVAAVTVRFGVRVAAAIDEAHREKLLPGAGLVAP